MGRGDKAGGVEELPVRGAGKHPELPVVQAADYAVADVAQQKAVAFAGRKQKGGSQRLRRALQDAAGLPERFQQDIQDGLPDGSGVRAGVEGVKLFAQQPGDRPGHGLCSVVGKCLAAGTVCQCNGAHTAVRALPDGGGILTGGAQPTVAAACRAGLDQIPFHNRSPVTELPRKRSR